MIDIVVNRNDNLPIIEKQFFINDQPLNLTGYTVTFILMKTDGTELAIRAASIDVDDPEDNKVTYQWTTGDNDLVTEDHAYAVFRATDGANTVTIPNNRPLSILLTDNDTHEYSYSGDPSSTTRDAVRFILSDTKAPWMFTNSEIDYMLTNEGSPYGAAAELAAIRSANYVDKRDKTVGPLSIKYGEIGDRWRQLARELRARGNSKGGAKAILTQKTRLPYFKLGDMDRETWNSLQDLSQLVRGLELDAAS